MGGAIIRRVIFDLVAVFAIISLYLWVEPPIFIVAQLPPFPDQVTIVAKPGVF